MSKMGDHRIETIETVDDSYSQGRIVLKPGRMSGQATIGDTRLPVEPVVRTYVNHGFDTVIAMWPQLTEIDIKLACWWWHAHVGRAGLLAQWAYDHEDALYAGEWDAIPMPPDGRR